MSNKVGYRNNGRTSEEGINRIGAREYSKEGVLRSGDLLITQNGTPNNTVLVSPGDIIIGNNSPTSGIPDYFYHAWVIAADSVTITNNTSGNPRIDSIVAYINLSYSNIVDNDNPNGCIVFAAIPGTPSASPVVPTDTTIQAAVGASNPWVLLAQVAVANGFSSITTSNITDERPRAASVPRLMDNFADFVANGSLPSTSAGLSTTLPKIEAFVGGYQISKPDIIHLFTASKDTYVDISQTMTATTNDDYTYTPVTNGAAAPAIAANSIRLYKVVTSGSAITIVTDLRNTGPVGTAQLSSTVNSGWITGTLPIPNTVVNNGQLSSSLTFNGVDLTSILSPGHRLMTTRTIAAPTYMGGLLNGSSQYFTKTTCTSTLSTVTDNFTIMGYIEPTSYGLQYFIGRSDAPVNNSFGLYLSASGQLGVIITNGGVANVRQVFTYQSVPLNKRTHIALSYASGTVVAYIDGISVLVAPATTGGSAPTAAGVGGDFSIGRLGAFTTNTFPGYLSGFGVFNAVLSAATIRSYIAQSLIGSETNCIGAWSLNNTGVNQQAPGTNDLTATGGVGYTNISPYASQSSDIPNGILDYGAIQSISFSTNTVIVLQSPTGCIIPTSGGISAIAYSGLANPYGYKAVNNIVGISEIRTSITGASASAVQASGLTSVVYIPTGRSIKVSFCCPLIYVLGSSTKSYISIWDGTVGSGTQLYECRNDGSLAVNEAGFVVVTPLVNNKTYNIGIRGDNANGVSIASTATGPMTLTVELVPNA